MKIVVTDTRGIPNVMGGVETHCEELFPRISTRGFDVTGIEKESKNMKSYEISRI